MYTDEIRGRGEGVPAEDNRRRCKKNCLDLSGTKTIDIKVTGAPVVVGCPALSWGLELPILK